jgi:Zn-dependent membrane protease YugP
MELLAYFVFDFRLLLLISPALLLGMWAQYRIRASFAAAQQVPCRRSGAATAQDLLQAAQIYDVGIQEIGGHLSDHYDPRQRMVRLSSAVFHGYNLAAAGIAAHEVGHAIQHARQYAPLVIRNIAVPAASFGSNAGLILLVLGMLLGQNWLLLLGIVLFSAVVFFQLVNLPVEFNASSRAKDQLVALGVVSPREMHYVRAVLNAAALTYVAATLQAVLTLVYYVMILAGRRRQS